MKVFYFLSMNDAPFHFKQFVIQQDKCTMKVGTDAVLLGSWIEARNTKTILDVGTGTGIIAIMLAQKSNALVDAIDIDKNSCEQAKHNVSFSPWANRIHVFHVSLQNFQNHTNRKYDLIVSNPPYFKDASKASMEARNKARHSDTLSFDELIKGVKLLLNPTGCLYVILPLKEGIAFRKKAAEQGLYCIQLMKVKTKPEKEEKRLMMRFEFQRMDCEETQLIIQKENLSYTKEYIELTKEYYLDLK